MPGWLMWLVGMGLISLESVLLNAFGVGGMALQTGLVLTIYLGLTRELVPGALVLAALLLPIEWMVVGPLGYYSLGLVLVFLALRVVASWTQHPWGLVGILVAAVAVLVHALTMVLALLIVTPDSPLISAILWQMAPAAAVTGLATVLLARVLEWLDEKASTRTSSGLLKSG